MCSNRQLVLQKLSHTAVRKIRLKMSPFLKTTDFDLCDLTVWVRCDTPHTGVKPQTPPSVVQNKRCHPYGPNTRCFTVAVNMKLCTSELVLFHPGMQTFWWNQAQCVWSVTVRGMPTYAVKHRAVMCCLAWQTMLCFRLLIPTDKHLVSMCRFWTVRKKKLKKATQQRCTVAYLHVVLGYVAFSKCHLL